MDMKIIKWISIGLLALVVVLTFFAPWIVFRSDINSFMGDYSYSESRNFFQTLEIGWFFALLSIVFGLVLLSSAALAIMGHLRNHRDNFLSTGLLVVASSAIMLVLQLLTVAVSAGQAKASVVHGSYEGFGSVDISVSITAWPFVSLVLALGAFVCWTMYSKGSAKIDLGDIRAAAVDVKNFSKDDIKQTVAGVSNVVADVRTAVAPTWKCANCGAEVKLLSNFCPNCGTKKPE